MGHPENTEIERGRKTEAEKLKLWTVPKWLSIPLISLMRYQIGLHFPKTPNWPYIIFFIPPQKPSFMASNHFGVAYWG